MGSSSQTAPYFIKACFNNYAPLQYATFKVFLLLQFLECKFLKAGIEVDNWSIRRWITSSLTTRKVGVGIFY
jgi:hypothetical protein